MFFEAGVMIHSGFLEELSIDFVRFLE